MRRPIVAIDGPAGAGKSTVTRKVAEKLGYLLVDTGALYRAAALAVERQGVAATDVVRVGLLVEQLVARGAIQLVQGESSSVVVLLDGQDVSEAIRSPSVGLSASQVSAIAEVRAALLGIQRTAGSRGGVVMEGRDIGTVVFPDADAKFFLTASVEVRTQRRYEELCSRGKNPVLDAVRREVIERDQRDSTRPIAPLRKAHDAMMVDSSALSVEEVVEHIVQQVRIVEQKLADQVSRSQPEP